MMRFFDFPTDELADDLLQLLIETLAVIFGG